MNSAEQEFQSLDRQKIEKIALDLLCYTRSRALRYGFKDGEDSTPMLPGGYTLDDIPCAVYEAFATGRRKFKGRFSMWDQLKGGAKSILDNLAKLKEGRVNVRESEKNDPTNKDVSLFDLMEDGKPSPDFGVISNEQTSLFFEKLNAAPEVKKNPTLKKIIECHKAEVDRPADVAKMAGITVGAVYEARRTLRAVLPRIKANLTPEKIGN